MQHSAPYMTIESVLFFAFQNKQKLSTHVDFFVSFYLFILLFLLLLGILTLLLYYYFFRIFQIVLIIIHFHARCPRTRAYTSHTYGWKHILCRTCVLNFLLGIL